MDLVNSWVYGTCTQWSENGPVVFKNLLTPNVSVSGKVFNRRWRELRRSNERICLVPPVFQAFYIHDLLTSSRPCAEMFPTGKLRTGKGESSHLPKVRCVYKWQNLDLNRCLAPKGM